MQKDSTISLRIDSELKAEVEEILNSLGIPMTTAITMYFSQIKINRGIPFTPVLPKIKAYEDYSEDEIYKICEDAITELNNGKAMPVADYKKMMKERMKNNL